MSAIAYAILLGFGGASLAVIWRFALSLGGAPGTLATAAAMRIGKSTAVWAAGVLATLAGQLYVSLSFVAIVLETTETVLANSTGFGRSIAWVVTFLVAAAPAFIALADAARAEPKTVQHAAAALTAPLTTVGFFIFLLAPDVLEAGWGWVPHL